MAFGQHELTDGTVIDGDPLLNCIGVDELGDGATTTGPGEVATARRIAIHVAVGRWLLFGIFLSYG